MKYGTCALLIVLVSHFIALLNNDDVGEWSALSFIIYFDTVALLIHCAMFDVKSSSRDHNSSFDAGVLSAIMCMKCILAFHMFCIPIYGFMLGVDVVCTFLYCRIVCKCLIADKRTTKAIFQV